ncbi:MAG: hypothetical protein ACKV2Q_17735 [Planctomycetaceae bacterium]
MTITLAVQKNAATVTATDWSNLASQGIYLQALEESEGKRVRSANDKLLIMEPGVTLLGRVKFRDERQRFGIRLDSRRRHQYVVGKTGIGKSTLPLNMLADRVLAKPADDDHSFRQHRVEKRTRRVSPIDDESHDSHQLPRPQQCHEPQHQLPRKLMLRRECLAPFLVEQCP